MTEPVAISPLSDPGVQAAIGLGVAALLWWLGTGTALLLSGMVQSRIRWREAIGGLLAAGAALGGLAFSTGLDSAFGAYLGFVCGILIWGGIEVTFLTGLITGPVRRPCPAGSKTGRRFILATGAILWHELLILGALAAIALISLGTVNQTGLLTFLILTVMRITAKLNIFIGVPNFSDELLPHKLDYMRSYFRSRPVGLFYVLSLTIGIGIAGYFALLAAAHTGNGALGTAAILLSGLAALAVIEHLAMIAPIRETALWRWAMRQSNPASASAPPRIVSFPRHTQEKRPDAGNLSDDPTPTQ